jgi:hypothetical protein
MYYVDAMTNDYYEGDRKHPADIECTSQRPSEFHSYDTVAHTWELTPDGLTRLRQKVMQNIQFRYSSDFYYNDRAILEDKLEALRDAADRATTYEELIAIKW